MPEYQVDQMDGEKVMSSQMTTANTPIKAAQKASTDAVTIGADKSGRWVRVQQPGRPPFEFGLVLNPAG